MSLDISEEDRRIDKDHDKRHNECNALLSYIAQGRFKKGGEMNMSKCCFLITVLSISLAVRCTFHVPFEPFPKVLLAKEKYPLTVGIYIEPTQREQVYSKSGFCLVGAGHTWEVPVGEGLRKASIRSFSQVFSEVSTISSIEEGLHNSLNIVFTPSIRNFEISQSINTAFFLKATIVDSLGDIIYEREVPGRTRGSGPFLKACCFGVFVGESAFAESARSAFEDAFEKLFQDIITTVDFNKF